MAGSTDMTKGSPFGILWKFILPMILGNLFQQFYSMVDGIIVGRFVSAGALAAIGADMAVINITVFLIIGFCVGTSVLLAQYCGAGNEEMMRNTFGMALLLHLAEAVVISLAGLSLARQVLALIHTPAELMEDAVTYCMINLGTCFAPVFYNLFSNVLRALGNSRMPLIALIISSVMNIILDLLFVIAFHWGVAGVGIATAISQAVSAIFCGVYIVRRCRFLLPKRKNFRWNKEVVINIIRIGVPTALQNMFSAIGLVAVQSTINSFGTSVMAAFTAGGKIDTLALQPMISVGNGISTYVAQNYGAKQSHRIREGVRSALLLSVIFCGVITLVIRLFGGTLTGMFIKPEEAGAVLPIAKQYLNVVSTFYLVGYAYYIFSNAMRGMGRASIPLASTFAEVAVKVATAAALAKLVGLEGLWYAWPLAWAAGLVPSLLSYLRVKWDSGFAAAETENQ